jgi:uncharacterized HAD superfamily protein
MAGAIRNGISLLPEDLSCVVGIPRSGMLAATILTFYRHVPVTDLDRFLEGHFYSAGRRRFSMQDRDASGTVLVIDDSVASGCSMREAKDKIARAPSCKDLKIVYAAVYCTPLSRSLVDVCFEELQNFRVFEWNVFHSDRLADACVDIDGVLCFDPTDDENDDGAKYRHFLQTVQPKIIPTITIGTIVSSRLEKYRPETEAWLAKHGVQYKSLVLLDGVSAEERRRRKLHATFKARVYAKSAAYFFIESSKAQAIEIARLTQKPVLSVEDMRLYDAVGFSLKYFSYGFPYAVLGKLKRIYWRYLRWRRTIGSGGRPLEIRQESE